MGANGKLYVEMNYTRDIVRKKINSPRRNCGANKCLIYLILELNLIAHIKDVEEFYNNTFN